MEIRPATAADSPGIIDLIDRVYHEYDDRVNLQGAEADLLDLDRHYFGRGGGIWVLAEGPSICGSHAALPNPDKPQVCNFRRLYLDANLRGGQWGRLLMQHTIDWAIERGFARVEFWSDTRFERAHRFFARFGFRTTGEVREMHDGHTPYREFFFYLDLSAAGA